MLGFAALVKVLGDLEDQAALGEDRVSWQWNASPQNSGRDFMTRTPFDETERRTGAVLKQMQLVHALKRVLVDGHAARATPAGPAEGHRSPARPGTSAQLFESTRQALWQRGWQCEIEVPYGPGSSREAQAITSAKAPPNKS